MLVVPLGTENILARYLGARLDAAWLWQVIYKGAQIALDVPSMNGRPFLLIAGMGFDAEVVRRLDEVRRGHISYWSYVRPIWRTFWGHPFSSVSVEADGSPLYEGPGMVFVGNVPRYAIGLRILDRAVPDDGLLDVCVMRCSWQGPLLWHTLNVLLRRHARSRAVVYRQARQVRVWSEKPVPVQVDGDVGGWLPAEFEMTGKQVRFLVAPGWGR
jgi:diacylglycerol kinase family enzyme